MNFKKSFIGIAVLGLLITGCNFNDTKVTPTVADEATQQKTMTKVQNNVNEIMNKNYEYVLKNMGSPYCTSYYIEDKDSIKLEDIKEFSKIDAYVGLSYPKYTSDRKLEGSALYIGLENDKVTEVQTYDFMTYDIKEEATISNTDIIIDIYGGDYNISLEKIKDLNVEKYIGKDEGNLEDIVGKEHPKFEIYDKTIDQKVKGYILKDSNDEITKIFTVHENDNKVNDIKIIDDDKVIDVVKAYLSQK